jgi:pyridoxamine 5'-phosphate oxidase
MDAKDPIALFQEWFAEAKAKEKDDPTAMALGTSDASGRPAVRMVLLKGVDERGFVFYTNLDSPKARQLKERPQAALCFHWALLEKQVRVEGRVEAVSAEEADAYFASRPRLSQLGAWASQQSQPIAGRWVLEQAVAAVALRFPFGAVPRPDNWSGYRVIPEVVEFWHQRPFRHHDRQRFRLEGGEWRHEWLFP